MRKSLILALGLIFSGCAMMQAKHLMISQELRLHPVHKVAVFLPVFPQKVKRYWPGDLKQMLPKNQSAASADIFSELVSALSVNLEVDASLVNNPRYTAWAEKISKDLAKQNIPTGVEPMDLPADAVLLVGVPHYGTYMTQWRIQVLNNDPKLLGPPKWQHDCDLEALLVNPKTGKVLMDFRQEIFAPDEPMENPETLRKVLRKVLAKLDQALTTFSLKAD